MKKILSILAILMVAVTLGTMSALADEVQASFTVSSSEGTTASSESASRLVNGVTTDKWCVSGFSAGKAKVVLAAPDGYAYKSTKYWFYTGNDINNGGDGYRNPTAWTLEGSNDGSTWTTLDTQTDQTLPVTKSTKTDEYSVSASEYYRYFRLTINGIVNNACMELGEFQMNAEMTAIESEDNTVSLTDFSSPYSTTGSSSVSYKMSDKFSLQVSKSDQNGEVTTAADGVSCYSYSTCEISLSNILPVLKITSVEMTFASDERSPSDITNGFDASASTAGIVVSGNKVTYLGTSNTVNLVFNPSISAHLKLTGVKVTYFTFASLDVSNVEDFKTAINYDIDVNLTKDIDLSGLTAESDGYLFNTYTHTLNGNNHALKNSSYPLFRRTDGATLKNLTLDDFHVTSVTSTIARTSGNSTFSHVTVNNSTITPNREGENIGFIIGYSDGDEVEYCTVETGCSISTNERNVGGLVGKMIKGKISYCRNSGYLAVDADRSGGIAGYIGDEYVGGEVTVEYCVNTGEIAGDDVCGGIAGFSWEGTITHCVNAGKISSADGKCHSSRGGIMGAYSGANVDHCINFGTMTYTSTSKGWTAAICETFTRDAYENEYCCTIDGTRYVSADMEAWEDGITDGYFTYHHDGFYQDVDKGTYPTNYPVPLSEAGTVHRNILCDGSLYYSTKYSSGGQHTSNPDKFGCCKTCGRYVGVTSGEVHITSGNDLVELANDVKNGKDYSNVTIYLDNDIDMASCNFKAIGSTEKPFIGTFDGQGHRIKNMKLCLPQGGLGLFGCVAGTSTIRNIIIDPSCSVTSTAGAGVAGLIGRTDQFDNEKSDVTIENCGNEAAITGAQNVAGILGGVYNNDENVITIRNCYNTGAITNSNTSDDASASICGYARKKYVITNCYSSGSLTGKHHTLYCPAGSVSSTSSVTNCYDVNGSQTGVARLSALFIESGDLCALLNKDGNVFTQTIGTDLYPVPGTAGLIGDPSTYRTEVSTAEELRTAVESVDASGNHSAKIKIINDIDLSTISANSDGYLFSTFNGEIAGQNYVLKNGTGCLFSHTGNATIEDVVLEGFKVTKQTSLIACTSSYTTFRYITVKNSSITHTSDDTNNFGMIVGWSSHDYVSYCIVESDCSIAANRRQIGGIAGESFDGTIIYCRNSATITGDADYIGGIVGLSGQDGTGKASKIAYCLNTGTINGDDQCGGIAGYYRDGTITHSVNTGTITSKDGDNHDNVGGIAGKIYDYSTCDNCINFGPVVKAKSEKAQFAIYGGSESTVILEDNDYYCDVKGSHFDSGISYEDLMSGKYAFSKGWLYQDIDAGKYTVTKYPVPLPEAGSVYSNILCDSTQSYSNIYQSTSEHESVTDLQGICSICGNDAHVVHIKTAAFLTEFSKAVCKGQDFSSLTIYLDNDIDMSDVTGFTPIGNSANPFIGTFDGQGHRIKNLNITGESYTGFFGLVGGDDKTVNIKNVIIDSSCSNTSTGTGVAGLIGCVTSTSGSTCSVTIENCGNEAAVTADRNVGGLLGAVFNNNTTTLTLKDCYNTGAVTGRKLVSALGYVRKNYIITNCYNSGTLKSTEDTPSLYRNETDGITSVENCYDITGTQDGVTKITADNVKSGELCFWLNGNKAEGTWGQTSEDSYPVLSGAGMQHYSRTMANQWGTICLPFDVNVNDDDNFDIYELSGVSGDALELTKVSTLAAGKPAIIRRDGSATGIEVNAVSGTTFAENPVTGSSADGLTLTGAYTTTEITDKDGYIINNNAFWNIADIKGENKVYCSPFRAYMAGTLSDGARCLTIGETTGINEVLNGANGSNGSNSYSPEAHQASQSNGLNGKFIINGRVVIIKNGKEYNANGQKIK